ncbi:MAG: protein kinase domain-containing protein, partial [Myxococcaceae bacterium]
MTCPSCGQPLDPQSLFCSRCGRSRTLGGMPPRDGDEPTVIPVRLDDVLEGKWRLEKKIGEGGMGTVYLAQDLALERPVAVKILSSTLVSDPEVVKRFSREARLTASLEHKNIVPIYAVGNYEGRPFIVMKKLDGETLAGELRVKGGFSLPETLALMRQLCSGLDFIHARGFVHRDIKAGNIFIAPDGDRK